MSAKPRPGLVENRIGDPHQFGTSRTAPGERVDRRGPRRSPAAVLVGLAYARSMRAVVFDFADPAFPASLADLPDPELPGPSWARIEVTTGSICGSDLHLFAHNTGPSPTLASIGTFPFVLGHETSGRCRRVRLRVQRPTGDAWW